MNFSNIPPATGRAKGARHATLALAALVFGLAGCSPPAAPDGKTSTTSQEATSQQSAAPEMAETAAPEATMTPAAGAQPVQTAQTSLLTCEAQIGAAAAKKLVDTCIAVSPATHPPCNAANSCALIRSEIARSCALSGDDETPMPQCRVDPKSVGAAVAVIQRYYDAINARDYGTAWEQWGDNGAPGEDFASFRAGFAHTRSVRLTIGKPGQGDAGAGSIYQPVPVMIDTTRDDGSHQKFKGTYVLRRVNGVDGATVAQLEWHIGSGHLSPVS